MSTFSWEYKPYFQGGGWGLWKSTFFPYTFNFLPWSLLFSKWFLALKNVDVYSFFGGWGGVSEGVWFVHSWKCWHYGWPLTAVQIQIEICWRIRVSCYASRYLIQWDKNKNKFCFPQIQCLAIIKQILNTCTISPWFWHSKYSVFL